MSREAGVRRARLLALVVSIALVAAACGSSVGGGEWPSLIGELHNSRYQADSKVTSKNVAHLHLSWMVHTNASVTSTPVVVGGNVYFADWGGYAWSVKASNGHTNWRVDLRNAVSSTVLVANHKVYVALSPYNTAVYPPNLGNRLVALDQSTGRTLWTTPLPSTGRGVWASPILVNGLVIVGTAVAIGQSEADPKAGGSIFAVHADSGKVVVVQEPGRHGRWWWSMGVDRLRQDARLDLLRHIERERRLGNRSLRLLDRVNGPVEWSREVAVPGLPSKKTGDDYDFGSTPNVFEFRESATKYETVVGVGSKDGNYYIVSAVDGRLFEKIGLNIPQGGGSSGLAGVLPGPHGTATRIFVPTFHYDFDNANPQACCGGLAAVEPALELHRWTVKAHANVLGSVSVAPGVAMFGDQQGWLYAVADNNGAVLFTKHLGASIESGPTLAEGHVFVATAEGDPSYPPVHHPMLPSSLGVYAFVP